MTLPSDAPAAALLVDLRAARSSYNLRQAVEACTGDPEEQARLVEDLAVRVSEEDEGVRERFWDDLYYLHDAWESFAPGLAAEMNVRLWVRDEDFYMGRENFIVSNLSRRPRSVVDEVMTLLPRLANTRPPEVREPCERAMTRMRRLLDLEDEPGDPTATPEESAEAYLARVTEACAIGAGRSWPDRILEQLPTLNEATQRLVLRRALSTVRPVVGGAEDLETMRVNLRQQSLTHMIVHVTARFGSTFDQDERAAVLDWLAGHDRLPYDWIGPVEAFARTVERWADDAPLPGPVVAALRRSDLSFTDQDGWEVSPGEAWTDALLAALDTSPGTRPAWSALLGHARTATSARPSDRWLRLAGTHLAAVGPDGFAERLAAWLPLVGRPRTVPLTFSVNPNGDTNLIFDEFNANILRGLLWMLPLAAPQGAARLLGHVVQTSLRKVAGVGPRSPKIANAAVYALSRLEGEDALGQLTRLSTQVTFKTTLKEIQKALDAMAQRLGVTRDDLAELGVPTYGLTDVGFRREVFGACAAELHAQDGHVRLAWSGETGRPVKAPPASVKRDFPDDLADLKSAVKDVEKMLAAQRDRLDALMLTDRTWPVGAWRERYLDHPLVGVHARRLIWTVNGTPALWSDGALRDVTGAEIEPTGNVKLWHPLLATVDEVVAWRGRLEALGVRQPFKQAHREVYLLTDAERTTRTYSNRFAAHVLRQHQFAALAALRGWDNKLRLMVDDEFPPATRELPQYGLRAEFWVEGIGDDHGVDTNDSGTYLRLSTDQVRFYPMDAARNSAHASGGGYGSGWRFPVAAEPVPLDEVPPLVLSEVLRDVDLFVGVASVGNDPTWQDGGPQGRFRDYWQTYSFGDLGATAQTRRDVLARLLPRLRIADRCSLTERFLVVRGDLRTYRIHLGSGNILMEPNDQYLCIVPARGAAAGAGDTAVLPFEGDATFSVILSKAFLLANDTAITDVTITRQIRPV
ncbi:DUF4132 domain-containing protein [Deinococcus pimensis]|uniref:DUF4132 domain-containing protein n=1 Tax=Deinococcus pimensis TaxID=309888 RepID=UPI0004B1B1C8|nr:DUF4132 domain-containing protein [Deinococcus pimensis]